MKVLKLYMMMLIVGMCCSCDEYLEVKNYGQVLPETDEDYATLINNQLSAIDKGTAGAANMLGSFAWMIELECYSDNLNTSLMTSNALSYIYVGTNVNSAQYRFMNYYSLIKDYNIIIDNLKERDTELGKKILATAYAMRGVMYFNLMRECCEAYEKDRATEIMGVPNVEHFDIEAKPGRGNIQELVNFIVRDLETAIQMNQTDEQYRFTADVARAYLARTYFWAQDWKNAIKMAKEVLDKYPLVDGDEYKEMIQSPQGKLGDMLFRTFITGSLTAYNRNLKNVKTRPVNMSLINLFPEKERDIRYTTFFDSKYFSTKGIRVCVRAAEMCLILAESYAHLSDTDNALTYLNLLRSKRIADYVPYTVATLPAVDESDVIKTDATGAKLTPLMSAVLNERRKEMFMEGDRWFELKRNGSPEFWVGYNFVKYTTEKYLYTFPLRKADLIANENLVQNPGYENL